MFTVIFMFSYCLPDRPYNGQATAIMIFFRLLHERVSENNCCCAVIAIALLFVCFYNSAYAQQKELLVATKEAPPFSMKSDDGSWSGISITLWRDIAGELDLK